MDILQAAVLILRSNYAFWFIFCVFFLVSRKYKKLSKDLIEDLASDDLTSRSEIWNMVKEESKKGNVKAKLAVVCYRIEGICVYILMCMIFIGFV
ncbi:MAG: hypothetical protein Q4C79_06995 [Neisseria sp.]|nr:hypothetical protein [Neisseria sp.]